MRGVRRDAAFVFQNYSLLPWFTALENVRLAVERDVPRADARRATASRDTRTRAGRPRQCDRSPAAAALRRHASARRDRASVRDRAAGAVSRRTVRRARRADARDAAAGARPPVRRRRAAGDDGDDHEQRRRSDPAVRSHRADHSGTASHARHTDSGGAAAAAQPGAARARRAGDAGPRTRHLHADRIAYARRTLSGDAATRRHRLRRWSNRQRRSDERSARAHRLDQGLPDADRVRSSPSRT